MQERGDTRGGDPVEHQKPRQKTEAEIAFEESARMRELREESQRKLRELDEAFHRGPVYTFSAREAFKRGLEFALRRLRSLPATQLTDDRLRLASQEGDEEIIRFICERESWLDNLTATHSLLRTSGERDEQDRCFEKAKKELRLELAAYRAERLRDAFGDDGPNDGRRAGEITLAQAAREFDVPRSEWSRAVNRRPGSVRHLSHRRLGRNVFVQSVDAKNFAEDYSARREQRTVESMQTKG